MSTNTASQVITALKLHGIHAHVAGPSTVVDERGRRYDVEQLATQLAKVPVPERDAMVNRYVIELLTAFDAASDNDSQRREHLLVRILRDPEADLPPADRTLGGARVFCPPLILLPAFDLPDTVTTVTDPERLGGWSEIWPIGLSNLAKLERPTHTLLDFDTATSLGVHSFESPDVFGASRVLIVDDLLADALGHPVDAPHGLLLAVPDRHTVLAHVLGSAPATETLRAMALASQLSCTEERGGLSSFVYYRPPNGPIQAVAVRYPDGTYHLDETTPPFSLALVDLAAGNE